MSHRIRRAEKGDLTPVTAHQGSQLPAVKAPKMSTEKTSTASQRLSIASNSSGGRRSSTSLDSHSGAPQSRPSGIPRPTRTTSNTRVNTLSSSRATVAANIRPKPLSAATGVATRTTSHSRSQGDPVLMNRGPRIVTDEDLTFIEPTLPLVDVDDDTVFGVAIPSKFPSPPTNLPPRLIPELQALAAITQRRPTPAMSTISTVSSPSTQFTASPSPWSASTTTTTPISWSSASPSLVQAARAHSSSKRSQTVPLPTVARTKMPMLPVLAESSLSSASSSNANLRNDIVEPLPKLKKKTPFSSPAPTPPPRSSSIKRTRSRSGSKSEDSKPASLGGATPPMPSGHDYNLGTTKLGGDPVVEAPSLQEYVVSDNHQKLQDAINSAPPRPSRDDTQSLAVRRPQRVNANHTRYNEQARKLMDAAPIESLPQSSSQLSLQSSKASETEMVTASQSSRSKLTKFSKMALFGRSPKKESKESKESNEDDSSQRQPRKLQRRGPAAGTGHEGYGRFGRKERKTSSDANNTSTDSETSVASVQRKPMRSTSRGGNLGRVRRDTSGQSDLDDFASSRLKPVVILGGSQKGTDAVTSQLDHRAHTEPKVTDTNSHPVKQEEHHQVTVPSSGPLMRESRLIFHLDSLDTQDRPNLAYRRSQKFDRFENFRIPEPIDTSLPSVQPYTSGYNTSQSSIAPTSAALTDAGNDWHQADADLLERRRKKSRKLNWNIFRKKEAVPAPGHYGPRSSSRAAAPRMAVQIAEAPPSRPTPYYAMLESENEVSSTEAISDFLTEAARTIPDYEDKDRSPVKTNDPEWAERAVSILLPSAPHFKRDLPPSEWLGMPRKNPESHLESASASQEGYMLRQPRLAQVGRIPKVVSTRRANEKSFHLPFQYGERNPTHHLAGTTLVAENPRALAIHTDLLPSRPFNSPDSGKPASAPVRAGLEQNFHQQGREYSKFPERYSTTSSSSDGMISVMGPPLLPLPDIPRQSKRYTTTEEDVWNEYDDFIDRVISPPRLKKSATRISNAHKSSATPTFKYVPPAEEIPPVPQITKGLAIDTSLAPPPLLFKSASALSDGESEQDFRLRRSRIVSALHSSLDPSSPFSIGDYLVDHRDGKRDSEPSSRHASGSVVGQTGLQSPTALAITDGRRSPNERKQYESAVQMNELQRVKNPVRHSEQSYASLMISRWLSFDQVLFSPAHADLLKQQGRHVLVIDGLGNDDWSIYCAVTYQTQQTYIHDLKESAQSGRHAASRQLANAPANFRRCELGDFNEVFRFPDNFFSVVVLRFLPVMAESKLKNIISECRRVLAPGGYVEMMLLELDISNMGVTTRRAMRELKMQMAMRNREVSLKPVIDGVQSVLGEKGFSNVRRFVMGLPVVGQPPGAGSPTSSRSSGSSDRMQRSPTKGPQALNRLKTQLHNNFSLSDLVADHSENADAKIGKVVSRTARSWWQHCFETAVISDGNLSRSIFADKHVVSECKARASCFKFLIAHAQKPLKPAVETRRRTMSEPVVATLVTA